MPPLTTKKRTTTNLKTKTKQNCQKTELYRSLTTKELKKKYSSRSVGGAVTGGWVDMTHGKATDQASEVVAGGQGGPTFMSL